MTGKELAVTPTPNIQLDYDRGSILVKTARRAPLVAAGVAWAWDERVHGWRVPAFKYRAIKALKLEANFQ